MLFALILGCPSPTEVPTPVNPNRTACDPLDEGTCLFPFPSSHHLIEDPSTETGWRVNFVQGSFLTHRNGTRLDPANWNVKDGFSINSTMLFWLEGGTDAGLISWDDIGAFAAPEARTVLIDTVTGERVPHFVDLDATAADDDQRAYSMHPAAPLEYDREYVVGVRNLDGAVPTSAFATLRDAQATAEGDLVYRVDHFDQVVFPALEAEGFSRGDLQLAWSFRTTSRESSLGEMVQVRDEGLATVGPTPDVMVVSSQDEACDTGGNIGRTIELEVVAPLYTVSDGPGAVLNRDASGPAQNGTTTFEITVRIPCSVLEGTEPAPLLQYGHGLLGERSEVRTGWLSGFAHQYGWVPVATDWTGMSIEDIGPIINMAASDPSGFNMVPERSMQGLLQQLLVIPAIRAVADDPVFIGTHGQVVITLDDPGYYGNSQGGIMGGAFMGLSQEIHRGVFGVTGVNYGLTLPRSKDFDLYYLLIRDGFADGRDIALLVQGLFQQLWDATEGAGYLRVLNQDPLPNTPAKQVLLHTAIGDNLVTTLGGQIQARAYGAKLIAPAYRPVFGLEEVSAGFTGSALVEWHYSDAAIEPHDNLPPDGPDPHECPRREPTGQRQIDVFLRTGVVQAPCDGDVCSSTVAAVCP